MIVRSRVRDCLYLNWALPVEALPELPPPLRYDVLDWRGGKTAFATALLFRQHQVGFPSLLIPRIDAPQFQLLLCTLDDEGVPSVWIQVVLVPSWIAPGARLVSRQPTRAARLAYPETTTEATRWRWEVRRHDRLVVEGEAGSPTVGAGPRLGSWEETVAYFRRRGRAYAAAAGGLQRFEILRPPLEATPVKTLFLETDLLCEQLPALTAEAVPPPHSSWLCAPMEVVYETGGAEKAVVGSRIPAPG